MKTEVCDYVNIVERTTELNCNIPTGLKLVTHTRFSNIARVKNLEQLGTHSHITG